MDKNLSNISWRLLLMFSFCLLSILVYSNRPIPKFYIENIFQDREDVSNQYWDIQKDTRDIIYVANPSGVFEFDGNRWHLIPLPLQSEAFSLAMDDKGRIYVGGRGELGYLSPDQKGEMKYISMKEDLPEYFSEYKGSIVNIEVTSEKVAFMSDNFMFIKHQKIDSFTVVQAPSFLFSSVTVNDRIFVIDDSQGLMELRQDQFIPVQIGRNLVSYVMIPYKNKKIIIVSPNKGLILFYPDESSLEYLSQYRTNITKYDIKSGVSLNNGRFAFGSVQYGCIITDSLGNELYKVNTDHGLRNNTVYNVQQDNKGNIWLGLARGIGLIYDRRLQIPENEDTVPGFRAFIRNVVSRNNNLTIFAGNFMDPKDSLQTENQLENQIYTFPYLQNSFRFEFSCNQYYNRENIEYQYFLDGLDDEWSTWNERNSCEYTNLDGGKYTLHVRAKNENELLSQQGSYSFMVKPPWYESWWFYALQVGFLLLLLVIAGFLYRMGKSTKMAGDISGIVVVIIFKYIYLALGPIFAAIATGIVVFDILTSALVAYIISPAKIFTANMFEKLLKKKEPHENNETNNDQ